MEMRFLMTGCVFALALALGGCGGGGGNVDLASASSQTRLLPTHITPDGRITSTCAFNPTCSGNPYAPFIIYSDPAPPDRTTLSGIVRLQARGIEMANIELLPVAGYLPRYGIFGFSRDKFRRLA